MISDVLFDAIYSIEEWQREYPECYDAHTEHIEIVKQVMSSLQERLDIPPGVWPLTPPENLTSEQKDWWRVTCEAGIARWAERLRLLGPVSSDELIGRLDDAIRRQEEMLKAVTKSEQSGSGR